MGIGKELLKQYQKVQDIVLKIILKPSSATNCTNLFSKETSKPSVTDSPSSFSRILFFGKVEWGHRGEAWKSRVLRMAVLLV